MALYRSPADSIEDAVGTMAMLASRPPASWTKVERMILSSSLSSAPPIAMIGPRSTPAPKWRFLCLD